MLYEVVVFIITYLICSINPAIEICKRKTGEDIRKLGSGNAGTANAMRVLGKPLGLLVVILDIAKVFLSFYIVTFIGKIFKEDIEITLKSVFMIASVVGHCFPIYYKLKGGKGVIVGIVAAVIIDKKIALVCLIIGVVILLITRIASLAALSGLFLYVVMTLVMMPVYTVPIIISALIIMFKHRASIQRLITRQESKF